MVEHAVIVAGGDAVPSGFLKEVVGDGAYVIAVDRGVEYVLAAGIKVDLVLGDFDSVTPERLEELRAGGVEMEAYPLEKNESDLELALRSALLLPCRRITVVCALGGRLDHEITNLMCLLIPHEKKVPCRIISQYTQAGFLLDSWDIEGEAGDVVTLVPVSSRVPGVVTTGLRYPLNGEVLLRGTSRGLSNELEGRHATVRASGGLLLIIVHRRGSEVPRP